MSREYTKEEMRSEFIAFVNSMVSHWSRGSSEEEARKIRGVVHSILCGIDGVSGSLGCGYNLVPAGTECDKHFFQENEENYYPTTDTEDKAINSNFMLHDTLK